MLRSPLLPGEGVLPTSVPWKPHLRGGHITLPPLVRGVWWHSRLSFRITLRSTYWIDRFSSWMPWRSHRGSEHITPPPLVSGRVCRGTLLPLLFWVASSPPLLLFWVCLSWRR